LLVRPIKSDEIEVVSLDGAWKRIIVVDHEVSYDSLALSPDSKQLALGASYETMNWKRALSVADLESGIVDVIRNGDSFDPQWFPSGDRIAYSNGTSLCSIGLHGENDRVHLPITRSLAGPQSLAVSSDERYICGFKWKGDKKHLATCDLAVGSLGVIQSATCQSFSWLDSKRIAYDSFNRGIRLCDVSTGKTTAYIPDLKIPQFSGSHTSEDVATIMRIVQSADFHDIDRPLIAGGRVYFLLHTYDDENMTHYYAVLSAMLDRSDLQCHYLLTCGTTHPFIVTNYVVLNSGSVVAAEVVESDGKIRIGAEWRLPSDCDFDIPKGYFPLPNTVANNCGSAVPWLGR
jgi:hypothetical protein